MSGRDVPDLETLNVERRSDGAVLVRVPSLPANGSRLPDAVFAFRVGDPQYSYWEQFLLRSQPTAGS